MNGHVPAWPEGRYRAYVCHAGVFDRIATFSADSYPVRPKDLAAQYWLDMPRAAVPQGRTRRLLHLGRAVGELAAGAAAEGVTRLARGERPALSQLMLTPANARRLAERLSQMRGRVMKVGQLMSMDGKGVLPPAFAELLGGLRDRAHHMPATQLIEVLSASTAAAGTQRFAASASSRLRRRRSARCTAPRRTTAACWR
jgi:hypothetical protein